MKSLIKTCPRCGIRSRPIYPSGAGSYCRECSAEYNREWSATNSERRAEYNRAWVKAHPEQRFQQQSSWGSTNSEHKTKMHRAWVDANPERVAEYLRAWAKAHPERITESTRRRRARKSGAIEIIRIEADHCILCQEPLDPHKVYPDPMSTTIGHEPPLSRLLGLGQSSITERPEHLRCNLWKGVRLDSELPTWVARG